MKIAASQIVSGTNKAENLVEIARLAAQAASDGADLAVFPEFAMYYTPRQDSAFVQQAESLDGEFVTALRKIADEHGIMLIAGMHEKIDGEDRAYNTLVAVAPQDGLVGVYHKQHLYDAFGYKESDFIRPGELDGPITIEVGDVKVGLLTCYDLRFPEAARTHADAGVHVLVYPAAWMPGPRKEDHWNTLARARAIENTMYVAAISQGPPFGTGGTLIVDPMGLVLGEIGEANGIAVAHIEPERIEKVRSFNPSLANRRYAVSSA